MHKTANQPGSPAKRKMSTPPPFTERPYPKDPSGEQSTNWILIQQAMQEGAQGRVALGELLKRYERTIRYLIQKRGPIRGMTVDDILQDFSIHLMTPQGDSKATPLSRLDPLQGSFRGWLAKAVRNKVLNVKRASDALRRGPDRDPEDPQSEAWDALPLAPDMEDDLSLAEAYNYCEQALERMRPNEPRERFQELRRYLPGSPVREDSDESAERLQLQPNALTKAISRFRSRFMAELAQVTAERIGSRWAHPSLDRDVQAERDRILELLRTHEWYPSSTGQ